MSVLPKTLPMVTVVTDTLRAPGLVWAAPRISLPSSPTICTLGCSCWNALSSEVEASPERTTLQPSGVSGHKYASKLPAFLYQPRPRRTYREKILVTNNDKKRTWNKLRNVMSVLPTASTNPQSRGRWAWMRRQAQEQRARANP